MYLRNMQMKIHSCVSFLGPIPRVKQLLNKQTLSICFRFPSWGEDEQMRLIILPPCKVIHKIDKSYHEITTAEIRQFILHLPFPAATFVVLEDLFIFPSNVARIAKWHCSLKKSIGPTKVQFKFFNCIFEVQNYTANPSINP